ncbi:MAG TPA: NADPH-dependent FMN reductase [Bacteroidia bacterium]|jgi:NAD(P)H-dependent FMN reductase|nr:NADPH-dependent FMN reductase [Bacteroidia bacterium]
MLTIISGTNRKGSNTIKVARAYEQIVKQSGSELQFLSLEDLPRDFAFTYLEGHQTPEVKELVSSYFSKADKFIFIIPEYHGTFPGIFKLLIDAIPARELAGKKVLLVGVAVGRGGNLRGLDHLTNALHYIGMNIYPKLLPISKFGELTDGNGMINDEATLKSIRSQVEAFLRF